LRWHFLLKNKFQRQHRASHAGRIWWVGETFIKPKTHLSEGDHLEPCCSMADGMLRRSVLEATARAKQSQALRKITAGHELLPPGELGVRYVLFSADMALRKPAPSAEQKAKPAAFRDPFAAEHLEQDLFVTRVHDTHNLVLNKFCVVEEHVVLPTIDFRPQEEPLSVADLRAMWTAMGGLDAFAFFNCGYESGASQPHKHMQLNSYPSFKQFTGLDMVRFETPTVSRGLHELCCRLTRRSPCCS
jgi:ATP adenylyltransferase/5',5'''-P-1,P-4-tetraphosphate phosphorylase II